MKRILIILSALLLVISLFGCSKKEEQNEPKDETSETVDPEVTPEDQVDEEPVEEVTEIEIEEGESTGGL